MIDPKKQLAETFADIARELQAEHDPERTRDRVTAAAVDTIAGCDHAAISLIRRRGGIVTVASTSEVGELVDAIQYRVGQGPCLGAISEERTLQADDLALEERWPDFSRRAVAETGVRSMLSFRLFVEGDTIGAMNLYSLRPAAFGAGDRTVGAILAAHAAIAMVAATQREHAENLDRALQSNRHIGMAMGILMARRRLTEEQAFQALRTASQHLQTKLRDVADEVIETGVLPEEKRRSAGP